MGYAHFSLHENQDVWVLSLHVVLETLNGFNLHKTPVVSSHLLLAQSQTTYISKSDTRRAISAWPKRDLDGNDHIFGARAVSSAESCEATFTFFVCLEASDATGFSSSGTGSAFRFA